MDAEFVLFQVVVLGEEFVANVTLEVPAVEMNAENVPRDSAFVVEILAAPVALELFLLVRSSDVSLETVWLEEGTWAVVTEETRC